ncbi:diguanylate cyclase domain-containing protein [Natranaerofaba carboxydovora]|uniref:diguanylate cyclase domain-containing protein n=1 Tax=Natranaerofaba carboxydovora TaxID=2742683 RepID=UPI001F13FD73|nr:diguanylate cyclase [Natranaerofaba carboxydovora]UMZ73984.1 Cyclic di-GMP phosphodiesterase response regulator RpfG [Natranaerofaba carboxydovora]
MPKAKILIVEDTKLVALQLKDLLEEIGYQILDIVKTGEEAIEKVRDYAEPDLILMDIGLQGDIDGIETKQIIDADHNIPVIYLTGASDEKTLNRVKITEPFGYILKPFNKKELLTNIEMALHKAELEKKLRESEKWFKTTLESLAEGVITTDTDWKVNFINSAAERIIGGKKSSLIGKFLKDIFYVTGEGKFEGLDVPVEKMFEVANSTENFKEAFLLDKEKNKKPIEFNVSPIREEKGELMGTILVFRDISDKKEAEMAIKESEEKYRTLVEQASDGVMIVEEEIIKYANPKMEDFLGYTREELLGKQLSYFVPSAENKIINNIIDQQVGDNQKESLVFETTLKNRKDFNIQVEMSAAKTYYKRKPAALLIVRDITERKKQDAKIRYLSFHDSLTGLYNRAYFDEELKRIDTERQLPLSIILGDVNGLKLVNDTFGHYDGDKLIKKVADILRKSARKEDIIARWGGDEFIILLPQTPKWAAKRVCERINERAKKEDKDPIPVTIALGCATKTEPSQDIHEILKDSEYVMYKNKIEKSKENRGAIVNSLLKKLDEHSDETEEHNFRMQMMALELGEALGLTANELDRLSTLVSLHDLGKITVPKYIFEKTSPLTDKEWELLKEHPGVGCRIARSTNEFVHIAGAILSHHERWDGKGYPQGLKGEEIPLVSRIVNLTDSYEVMTSSRSYKKAMSKEEAVNEIKRCEGTQFDPRLVDLFISKIIK